MSILILSSGFFLGYEAVTLLAGKSFAYTARVAAGISIGSSFQAMELFFSSQFFQMNIYHGIVISCLNVAIGYTISKFKKCQSNQMIIQYSVYELFSIILSMALILSVVWLANLGKGYMSTGPSLADLPFHMNIAASFAYGVNIERKSFFDVMSVFEAGLPLVYPFLHNFYVSCFISFGMTISKAMKVTAIPSAISMVILLNDFIFKFTKSRTIAALSLPMWVFLGGFGWMFIFYPNQIDENVNFIQRLSKTYNAAWMQNFIQMYIPQRSMMFAFPLVILTLSCLMEGIRKLDIKLFVLASLSTMFLPQIQIHAYVAVAIFSVSYAFITFLFSGKDRKKLFKLWLIYGVVTNIVALPLTAPYWERSTKNERIFTVKPIWADNKTLKKVKYPLIGTWWNALGPFALVMICFGWVAADGQQIMVWFGAMVVWLATNFIRFQPWYLDNVKLLADIWIPVGIAFVLNFYGFVWNRTKSKIMKCIIAFLVVQNMFSGILCLGAELKQTVPIIRPASYQTGKWIIENTPVSSAFFGSNHEFTPASSIAGRMMYNGYDVWIRQHGIDAVRPRIIERMLEDRLNVELFKEHGVSYAVTHALWGFDLVIPKNQNSWIQIYHDSTHDVYKLNVPFEEITTPTINETLVYETPKPTSTPVPRRSRRSVRKKKV